MQIKVFTIPLSNAEQSEAEVNAFIRGHRVLQIDRHFASEGGYWTLFVEYMEGDPSDKVPPASRLTSQYFANHYLAAADHYAKQQIGVKAMVRYMDDILLFAREKQELADMMNRYLHYLHECLNLESHEPVINRTTHGIPFLGYVVYGCDLRLNKRSKKRYHAKMKELAVGINLGEINEGDYVQHAQCLTSFVAKANTQGFRGKVMKTKGMYLQGL